MFVSGFITWLNVLFKTFAMQNQNLCQSSQFCLFVHLKGITFGRRSNKLDLYHPPNVGKTKDMLAPLVVFIYGGAWGSGERSIYCLLAKQMAEELNATVICPDYCIYPKVLALEPRTVVLMAYQLLIFVVHM